MAEIQPPPDYLNQVAKVGCYLDVVSKWHLEEEYHGGEVSERSLVQGQRQTLSGSATPRRLPR